MRLIDLLPTLWARKGILLKEGKVTGLYKITKVLHEETLTQTKGSFSSTYYQPGNANERGARGYNCTPKQAELILKAYKDMGVYLLEPDATPEQAVVEIIAAVTFAPCPSSDDEN